MCYVKNFLAFVSLGISLVSPAFVLGVYCLIIPCRPCSIRDSGAPSRSSPCLPHQSRPLQTFGLPLRRSWLLPLINHDNPSL